MDIIVAGYPRSGNTWLSRLLGEVLQAPVTGWRNAVPLAREGLDRASSITVRQLHVKPCYEFEAKEALLSAYAFATNARTTQYIVHIMRDPRDVAVSVKFYWELDSFADALECVATGAQPLAGVGVWKTFNALWFAVNELWVLHTTYESLHSAPESTLRDLTSQMGVSPSVPVKNAVDAQEIGFKRKLIASEPGDARPYGSTIQLKHLRKGIVGDWRTQFSQAERELAFAYFQDELLHYGYEEDDAWLSS